MLFKKTNKKANLSLYIVWFILAIIIILTAALIVPMGTIFATTMYAEGEKLLVMSNSSIERIQDQEVKDRIQAIIGSAKDSAELNIETSTNIFKYSWLIVIIITIIVLFLIARSYVEINQGGGIR